MIVSVYRSDFYGDKAGAALEEALYQGETPPTV